MSDFSTKNKGTNTFRFKSFADRVNEIDIRQNALYRIQHENEEFEDTDETIFHQTLRKWSVLNLTEEYSKFYRKCQNIVTLPQLIHKKDFVLDLICATLDAATTLSLEPVLDALVAFSKDLREEFYPYFGNILEKLVVLLQTRDPDQLEWTLKCLAFLFKSLRPFLKRNIDVVLSKVVPLLDNINYPDHVINFASESFSFVARDLKNHEKFILLVIKNVRKFNNGVSGCGVLFFELIRGVNGNFHTVAGDFLRALFSSFRQPIFDQQVLVEIVSQMIVNMLLYIQPCNMSLFWNAISEAVLVTLDNEQATQTVHHLVQFVRQATEWKNGKCLIQNDRIVDMLLKIADRIDREDVLIEVSTVVCKILQAENAKISQMDTSRLMRKMLSTTSESVRNHFVWHICQHPQFDILVLSEFIKYFERNLNIENLDLLVKIIHKRTNWTVDTEYTKYPITFQSPQTFRWLERNIENFDNKYESTLDLEIFLLSAALYSHLIGGKPKHISDTLKTKIENITNEYSSELAIALFLATESLLHIGYEIKEPFLTKIVKCILSKPSVNVNALRTLIVVFEYAKTTEKPIFTKILFLKVQSAVSDNFTMNNRKLRLMSAKALKYFANQMDVNDVYAIFYDVESITPEIHTYRQQLVLLQKLSPSGQYYKDIRLDNIKSDCLKFLLGLLHHNFKLLWEPILKLIEEFADNLPLEIFWSIYRKKIEEASFAVNSPREDITKVVSRIDFQHEAIRILQMNFFDDEDKSDFYHYRQLLWKAISTFGQMSEIKNKDIINLFLDFVNLEFRKSTDSNILTWDILKANAISELDDEETHQEEPRIKTKQQPVALTLVTMLEVFRRMANPKQLYRERELNAFYMELLSSTNEQLQKLSLDCVLTYKIKAHTAYKDHLYALIDDKKFKDELINFKLDTESKSIQSDHRADLMPILLRILYGKMRSKTNNKYIGSQMRRGIVMRFLAGCEKAEIFWFLQMAFVDFEAIIQEDCKAIPDKVQADLKLDRIWSPKKLRSALNLLELIRKHFGGLMESDFLIYMMKIILFVGSVCKGVFEDSDKIEGKFIAVFRNLRSSCLLSLVNFFDHFQDFLYQPELVQVIFHVFIWPNLDKLPSECLHSPTPLLRLFDIWSKNPRHFTLLSVKRSDGVTPLGTAMSLLISDKPKPIIRNTIMQIVERLLTAEEPASQEHSVGVGVVLPHIPQILMRLQKTLNAKGSRKLFGKLDLFILSRITQIDLNVEVCDNLMELILPIVAGKTRIFMSDESTVQFVSTLRNLMVKVSAPEKHIRSLSPLFEKVKEVNTRKQLCSLLSQVAHKVTRRAPNLEETSQIVQNLNAWNRKWVEQPDYDKRLTTLRDIKDRIDSNNVDMDLGILVIYNCFYFLHHDKDIGLRDSATECMKILVPKLVERYKDNSNELSYLIDDVILNLIQRILRDKNDLLRNEGVLLLGEIARNCPDAHPILRDLGRLSCKEDPEVDFFENITHLQSHRHGRALLKFCADAKTYEKAITSKTLTQFMLPLATRYLINEQFSSKHTLVDAAIETIGTVCRFLPWHQYQTLLKYYLQKMKYSREYHKQCVRILISILDAFHFDLSNAKEISSTQKQPKDLKMTSEEHVIKSEETSTEQKHETINTELDDNDLDAELDSFPKAESEEEYFDVITTQKRQLIPFLDRMTQLTPSAARRVVHTIASILIPSLNYSITELSSYESKHKLNRRKVNFEREEEESMRIPIALAIVKLLQKLPKNMLDASIQGVFMKVCTFLKSPVKSVRMLTRDILKKIMLAVGSEYLSILLAQMTALLTRGFQVHVLSVTLYSVLDCLKDEFKKGDIEKSLQYILKVTLNDIFDEASEEKEIDKIGMHTPEAKPSAKSFLSLHIASRNIPENCLLDILLPFKKYLFKSQSKKVLLKIQDCFQKIVLGLSDNENISPDSLLEFIYGIVSESIPDLLPHETKSNEIEKEIIKRLSSDCFLIAQEPKYRSGAVQKVVKTNVRANSHVLVEFGLELLHIILRRKKLQTNKNLGPLIPFLKISLQSQYVRVCTFAIKCLISIWNGQYAEDVIPDHIDDIVKQLFMILHKYFSYGVTRKDDSFQLVKSTLKFVGCIIRKCDYYSINKENMSQLLFYIGQDVNDSNKQPVAFSLLKALIEKKIYSSELHEIMQKLCEIAIISESDYAKEESRLVLLNYIMEFYREKKTDSILKFFVAQINYEIVAGRISSVKFIQASIKKYPVEVLHKKCELIFLALGTRLVNEDISECRVLTADCIEVLISRINVAHRQKLFDITTLFLNEEKHAVREMAATLCSRFVELEKKDFLPKAISVLPILGAHLSRCNPNSAGRFVKSGCIQEEDVHKDEEDYKNNALVLQSQQRVVDHEIIQTQNCIIKILEHCPNVLSENSMNFTLDDIAYESQKLLAYEHEWVRLNSVKIISAILSSYDFDLVHDCLLNNKQITSLKQFIYSAPEEDLKSLILDLCAQMLPGETNEEIAAEISKCLMYIGNMLKSARNNSLDSVPKVNLHWLLRRIRYVIYGEISQASQSTVLRQALFDWMEGIIALLDTETLIEFCPAVIATIIREMSEDDINVNSKIKLKALRICNKIRKRIGDEKYDKIRMTAQTKLMMKRASRKKDLAQEKILDPVRSAKRKSSQQERKKTAKWKKIDIVRGKGERIRKRKQQDLDEMF